MILFTQSTAVLQKYLNDELKILCLLQFFLRLHRIPSEFPEFSTFREIPEYSRFSRFMATLLMLKKTRSCQGRVKAVLSVVILFPVGYCLLPDPGINFLEIKFLNFNMRCSCDLVHFGDDGQ